ncbi:hypothetical protein L9F63_009016, partial [Diploptera punctata]
SLYFSECPKKSLHILHEILLRNSFNTRDNRKKLSGFLSKISGLLAVNRKKLSGFLLAQDQGSMLDVVAVRIVGLVLTMTWVHKIIKFSFIL